MLRAVRLVAILCVLGSVGASAAAAATVCGIPGHDGPGGTLAGVVNTYYPGTSTAAAGANSISVGAPRGSATPIAAGDLLLIVQMQDSSINSSNTSAYGANNGSGAGYLTTSAGTYEYVTAAGPVAAGAVPITGSGAGNGLVNQYQASGASAAHGQSTFQVVRVPQYSSATLGSTLTAAPWNGSSGGILALDVAGGLALGNSTVSVDGEGFRGGGGRELGGGPGGTGTDFRNLSTNQFHGDKGEGIAGTPEWIYDQQAGTVVNTGQANDGYPNGSTARGAPGNAGGGGTDPDTATNEQNTGGGGGGNGGAGGGGGNSWFSNLPEGGVGGAGYPAGPASLVLGGGGGSGTRNNSTPGSAQSSGGGGGGMVLIRSGSVTGTGTITANGAVGVAPVNDGAGGGGAGGSVEVLTAGGGLGGLTLHADGGAGTNAWPAAAAEAVNDHGPGGGGGGGVVVTSSAPGATSVAGGAHGTTTLGLAQYNAQNGSPGTSATGSISEPAGAGAGSTCLPNVSVVKTTSTPTVTNTPAGTTATYTITLSNASPLGTASQAKVSDVLPSGLTYASTGSFTLKGGAARTAIEEPAAGDTTPSWGTVDLPGGSSVAVTFTVDVASTVPVGTYSDTASGSYLDPVRTTSAARIGPSTGATAPVEVIAPDLTVAKAHVGPYFVRNSTGTWTVTVTNSGNAPTSGTVTLTDPLPGPLTYSKASGTGWSCGNAGNTVTCTRSDALAAETSYPPITIVVNVPETAPSPVSNTATVSGGGEINTTNDTATDSVPAVSIADIAVSKAVSAGTINDGQQTTFTVTAKNNGPDAASGVQVTDLLPAGLSYVSSTVTAGTYTPGTGVWNIGSIANGATQTLTITAAATASGTITNTATKTAENELDPTPGDDSASAAVKVNPTADIALGKSTAPASILDGQQTTFTVTAKNNGPDAASGVQVTDLLPAGLSYVSSTVTAGTYTPGTGVWNIGSIANGATQTLTITAVATAPGTITNTATKTAENEFDPTSGDDSASATVTIGATVDLGILKSAASPQIVQTLDDTFTLAITNTGPSDAQSVQVVDTLPPGLSYVSATPQQGSCSDSGQVITCDLGTVPVGSTPKISLVARGDAAGQFTNTATVSTELETDTNPSNNTSSTTITVLPATDLSVTKSGPASVQAGGYATYVMIATDNGPSDATGVVLTDQLPAGVSVFSADAGCTTSSQTVTCPVGDLAKGASAQRSLTLSIPTALGGQSTQDTAIVAGQQVDLNPANDSASVSTAVSPANVPADPGAHINLMLTKTVSAARPYIGEPFRFTIVVANSGPDAANNVTVTDPVSVGLSITGAQASQGSCVQDAQIERCLLGTIAPGASATITIDAIATRAGSFHNTAAVSGDGTQGDPSGLTGVASLTVVNHPSLTLAKRADRRRVNAGQEVNYTIVASAAGSAVARATVCDKLPAGMVFVTAKHAHFHNGQACWGVSDLSPSRKVTVRVRARAELTANGRLTNTATASAAGIRTITAHATVIAKPSMGTAPARVTG